MKLYLRLLTVFAVLAVPAFAGISIPGPHELPDPDTTPPDSTKPVKVYILSGQSNMVGMGVVAGDLPGTLETLTAGGMFPHMIDAEGAWTVRNDVWYEGVITATAKKWLTVGCGASGGTIGPELGFGHIMGYYHDEPVIVLKSSQGNRSISWDFAPPSTERFEYNGYIYAGYGDAPNSWLVDEGPSEYTWYAGKQYDDCFMDEADWSPTAVVQGQPPVDNVVDVLDNFATRFPQYAAQGFEIAGYAWWQGHKDQAEPHASNYEKNMVNFIKDLRGYYENRYPNNCAGNAPFVIATIAFNGWSLSGAGLTVANGQLAASDPNRHPEFEGSVKTVEARGFWRSAGDSPTTADYHYYGNAETYMLVGDALGRAMVELLPAYSVDAGEDMVTWSGEPVHLNAIVEDGVAVTDYAWSAITADPNNTVVFDSNSIEDPTVTISKNTPGDVIEVILKLRVNDGVNSTVVDVMKIEVYDDACKATRLGLGVTPIADISKNCIISLEEIAAMAETWINYTGLTEPIIKP